MRVLVDLSSFILGNPKIVQVDHTPVPGTDGGVNINGKFVIPIIKGVEFPIDSASTVLDGGGDVDGRDVSSISYAHLLAMYPMFSNVYFNPLLTQSHVGELDFDATFRDTTTNPPNIYEFPVRVQTGRPTGFAIAGPAGQMPTHTAVLPANRTTTPERPGVLITKEIDLSPYAPDGVDKALVYWKLLSFDTGHDYDDTPAIRTVTEPDQEPDNLKVHVSTDNGITWCPTGLLEPIGLCDKSTKIRLAFVNHSDDKISIATYGLLF